MSKDKVRKNISLDQEHAEVIDKKALNLSKYVRNKIEEDFPEEFT